jgi:ABC-type uncharacterized transport system substrate-binding protein
MDFLISIQEYIYTASAIAVLQIISHHRLTSEIKKIEDNLKSKTDKELCNTFTKTLEKKIDRIYDYLLSQK